MADREKVIKGLGCHMGAGFCDDCPYIESCGEDNAGQALLADVMALLKKQEPRLMTLTEVVDGVNTPAWFEGRSNGSYKGWVLIYDVQDGMGITGTRVGVTKAGHITIWPSHELYGSKWRCWTDKPTDAQREATPWC